MQTSLEQCIIPSPKLKLTLGFLNKQQWSCYILLHGIGLWMFFSKISAMFPLYHLENRADATVATPWSGIVTRSACLENIRDKENEFLS
jgi:hypothetical protein